MVEEKVILPCTQYLIQCMECSIRRYIEVINNEQYSFLKQYLAEEESYSKEEIYEIAWRQMQEGNPEYIFYILEVLAQNEIQKFAASFCFLPHYGTKYGYLFSKLHGINMPFATIELLWQIYCNTVTTVSYTFFLTELFSFGYDLLFQSQKEETTIAEQPVILKKEIVFFTLTGKWGQYEKLLKQPIFEKRLANDILWDRLQKNMENHRSVFFVITGKKGSGKKFLTEQYAYAAKKMLLCCSGKQIQNQDIFMIIAKAMLYDAVICLEHYSHIEKSVLKQIINILEQYYVFLSPIFFLEEEYDSITSDIIPVYTFETAALTTEQRKAFWTFFLEGKKAEQNIFIQQLANQFLLTQGEIKKTIEEAEKTAFLENRCICQKDLYDCANQLNSKILLQKTTKIKPAFYWEQLILPLEQKERLRQVCNRIHHQHIVYDTWGYKDLMPYGRGVSMLFAGKPGTGKTMAAQVMAKELGLDIYRVDLSQIVSKYIGETEKNINIIFEEALKSNVILFFDEMDALFSKRTEVKSANDRYVNMEVAFLLQKMEQYDGISILATNHLEQIDTAFFRRIQYIIQFPLPSVQQRYEIWRSVLSKKVPLEENIDFTYLANQFELSGGSIKNAVLTAVFLAAASKNQCCTMEHILKGIKQEMEKQGKVLLSCDFGEYSYLL